MEDNSLSEREMRDLKDSRKGTNIEDMRKNLTYK